LLISLLLSTSLAGLQRQKSRAQLSLASIQRKIRSSLFPQEHNKTKKKIHPHEQATTMISRWFGIVNQQRQAVSTKGIAPILATCYSQNCAGIKQHHTHKHRNTCQQSMHTILHAG
jgi:hypothetical protein